MSEGASTAGTPDYRKALAERSSYVENVLIHRLVAALAGELWRHDPESQLHIFNSEVDNSGFDLVLGYRDQLRYIQIKQVHVKGAASKFSVSLDFSRIPGSCVVLIVHTESDLQIDHCCFFGCSVREPMANIEALKTTVSPIKRGADGKKKTREHYRDIPRKRFQGPFSPDQLLRVLFDVEPAES